MIFQQTLQNKYNISASACEWVSLWHNAEIAFFSAVVELVCYATGFCLQNCRGHNSCLSVLLNFAAASLGPCTADIMAGPAHTYVQYFVPIDGDVEDHPNVFLVRKPQRSITLSDIEASFPLPGSYIFRAKAAFGKTYGGLPVHT